jgi:hypothetical protein
MLLLQRQFVLATSQNTNHEIVVQFVFVVKQSTRQNHQNVEVLRVVYDYATIPNHFHYSNTFSALYLIAYLIRQ